MSPIVAALALAACGGASPAKQSTVRIYLLHDGKLQPVARDVPSGDRPAGALEALFAGPTKEERATLGLDTAIPSGAAFRGVTIARGVADLPVLPPGTFPHAALAQIVYTLTQFPSIGEVTVGVRSDRSSRADYEDVTPAILVEAPLPGEEVRSPLRASGTANTFEATFEYDLVGPTGALLAHNFVTATSGNGVRGTFRFTQPYSLAHGGAGKLIVYERSAENGRRINQASIPLQLEP